MNRALIVEDLPAAQRWLQRAVSEAFPGIAVDTCDRLSAARDALRVAAPDLVLLDLQLPDGDGTELIAELHRLPRRPVCVVTTAFDDSAHLRSALRGGIDGYLLKERDVPEIVGALRRVVQGEPALSPSIARQVMDGYVTATPTPIPMPCVQGVALTPREEQVLERLARGERTAQIADALSISYHTAARHVRHLYEKLGVNSRAALAAEALRRRRTVSSA